MSEKPKTGEVTADYFGVVIEHTDKFDNEVVLLESHTDVDRGAAEKQAALMRQNTASYAKATVVRVQLTTVERLPA